MTAAKIVRFHQDEEGDWVADLGCGHQQHVRHRPPVADRPWVLTEEGRVSRLGMELECLFCNMPALPDDVVQYSSTAEFDQDSIPDALLENHRTKPGVWGRIVVVEGKLLYAVQTPRVDSWTLQPGVNGIVAPDSPHHVRALGTVRFRVEFLRGS